MNSRVTHLPDPLRPQLLESIWDRQGGMKHIEKENKLEPTKRLYLMGPNPCGYILNISTAHDSS